MQDEYQSTQPRAAAIEDSYSYIDPSVPARARSPEAVSAPIDSLRYRVLKRAFDIALIVLSTPVLLLVVALVAVLVRWGSHGPVFYSHRRIRQNGAFFSMWKFRTMCVNSAEVLEEYLTTHPKARSEWNRTHKLKCDPRVTPVGRFLRKYSIDELPQIWNVLRGQMTLVGPRPIVAAEVEKYGEGFYSYCRVKPGLTGLWQVSGRSELSYPQRVALDCAYVKHWSLRRDVFILLRTFLSVANKDGAY